MFRSSSIKILGLMFAKIIISLEMTKQKFPLFAIFADFEITFVDFDSLVC